MYRSNKLNFMAVMALLSMASTQVLASLSAGSVTNLSGSNNISRTNPSSVTVRWSMTSVGTIGNPPGATISSSTGVFTDGAGGVIGNNNKLLTKTIVPTIPPSIVNITESFTVPRSILYKASKMGLTQITYERSFTDCPSAGVCNVLAGSPSITLNLTGTTAGAFGISSYKLRFDNGKINQVVKQGDKLNAVAYVEVTRNGTAKAAWEVATPTTTSGTPVFRTLRTVQKLFTSVASNRVESPVLPVNTTGIYLLRFRFLDPQLEGEVPTLRYAVNAGVGSDIRTMNTIIPPNGASLSLQTTFEWQPVPGASGYKLEFIDPPANMNIATPADEYTPVAGLLVKGNKTSATINKAIAKNLKPGRTYWWHVIALNKNGQTIGASKWRSIQN